MAKKQDQSMDRYGLIGKNIDYSFSRGYFEKKFGEENIEASYENFDLQNIDEIENILQSSINLCGLNVTIPYKQEVIPYLDEISSTAKKIGAVNTIRFKGNKLKGYNTDQYGFRKSLEPLVEKHHKKALILGTGGASKAVAYSLKKMKIPFELVSRKKSKKSLTYKDLDKRIIEDHQIIINCTPLGTYPNTDSFPSIPYQYLGKNHILYDLVYNPAKTNFLSKGEERGAKIKNGQEMLILQAEKAWEIWNQ